MATNRIDKEAQGHDVGCWIYRIPFKQRTLYSCSCKKKEEYQKSFYTNRPNKIKPDGKVS